jgi:hypothetical protein
MKGLVGTLLDAVEIEPRGLRPTQLVQQVIASCLQFLTHPSEEELGSLADASAEAARRLRPPTDSDELWRAWYAGHMQAVAVLCRTMLRLEIPESVRRQILSAPNLAAILLAIEDDEELTQSQLLQKTVTTDASQLSREVARLQGLRVVDVAREGRQSWVRLSALGRRFLATPMLRQKIVELVKKAHRALIPVETETIAVEAELEPAPTPSPPLLMVRSNHRELTGDDSRARFHLSAKTAAPTASFVPVAEPPKPRKKTDELPMLYHDDPTI